MTTLHSSQIFWLKVFFGLLSAGMVVLVVITSLQSNMFQLPSEVVNEPWFRTTLVDFYFNICVIAAWTIYKEANVLKASVWILSFIFLGSIATCFYVFLQINRLKPSDGLEKIFLPVQKIVK